MRDGLKHLLNEQATLVLDRIGYSRYRGADAKREAWWWLQARGAALARRSRLLEGWSVVWTDVGRAELIPTEVPRPGRGEVTVAVLCSVVSPGTERAQYLRLPNARVPLPYRPGYSGAGLVLATGAEVFGLRIGQAVAVTGLAHVSVATVRAADVHAVPPGVPIEAAAMVQLGVICRHGIAQARIREGEPICVIGAGLIGALAQRLAVARGAGAVTVIARSRAKEETARKGGASAFLVAVRDEREIEALDSPVVIDASGGADAFSLAVAAAGPRGRIVLLGSPRGTSNVPVTELRRKGVEAVGAHVGTLGLASTGGIDAYREQADAFLADLASGRLQVADLVALEIDPREADDFYRDLARRPDIVGARFDWTRVPAASRVKRGSLTRLPALGARGVEPDRPLLDGRPQRMQHRELSQSTVGMLRIGLLGCGDIAVHNAAAAAAAPNVRLTACFDPTTELAVELAQTYGAASVASLEALLGRDDVDAVHLSVPHHLHAPLAIQAAEAGKHVIVEKPLAESLASAARIVEAIEGAGVTLSVCFPHRYEPGVIAAKRLVDEGGLGELGGSLVTFFTDKPPSYWLGGYSARSVSSWRSSKEKAGGGVLIMNLSHLLDLVRHISGLEVEECAAVAHAQDGPADVEDTISLTLRYANGATGTVVASSAARGIRGVRTELRLWGSRGHVVVEPELRWYTVRGIAGRRSGRWFGANKSDALDIRAQYLSRLATALHRGLAPDVTGADALAVQAVIEAAYCSTAGGGGAVSPRDLLREASR